MNGIAHMLWSAVAVALVVVKAAGAQPANTEFQVNTYTNLSQRNPAIAADASGNHVIVWESRSQDDGAFYGIFAQRYDAGGAPLGGEFQVNTVTSGDQTNPSVDANASGRFVVAWQSLPPGDIFAQRYDQTGMPDGSEFQVNAYTTGFQLHHNVAVDNDGNFVIVWYSPQDGSLFGIVGQRFTSGGAALGEFMVNTYTTGVQYSPAVATDGMGGFIVVWASDGQDGDGLGIFGQRYDSAGAPVGGEFQANTYTTGKQSTPAVAADVSGRFVVAWTTYPSYGDTNVAARRYDSTGTPQGDEFQVNSYTTAHQRFPAVALDADGNFVVMWDGAGGGDDAGVFGQRFSVTGERIGSNFLANTVTSPVQSGPKVAQGYASDTFVVAWTSHNDQDGEDSGVFGKRFVVPFPGITGKKITLKDKPDPTKRKLILRSKDPNLDTSPSTLLDPLTNGALIHVFNAMGGSDSACLNLPAIGWRATGNPAAPTYKYRDPTYTHGPCKSAVVKHAKLLKVVCSGKTQPLPYTLDEPTQGKVGVQFLSGATEYCIRFDGNPASALLRDEPGKFVAKNGQAACDVPPADCP